MSTDTPTDRPWRDADTLRRLYVTQNLERSEVAARLGCQKSTIDDWLNRHDIQKEGNKPYQDPDRLQSLYLDQGLTDAEIAEHFDVATSTITRARSELDIGRVAHTPHHYAKTDLARWVRHVDAAQPYRVTSEDVRNHPAAPSVDTLRSRFGSFDAALEAAGLDPDAATKSTAYRETLGDGQGPLLLANRDLAIALYDTEDPFVAKDAALDEHQVRRLSKNDLIFKTGTRTDLETTTGLPYLAHEWAAADGVREWIRNHIDLSGTCPVGECDATGIKNLGDGRYTCSSDACASEFDRDIAEEVLRR